MKYWNIYLALSLVVFSSCSPRLTPFTQDLYDENGWSDDDLKKIQFIYLKTLFYAGELQRDLLQSVPVRSRL